MNTRAILAALESHALTLGVFDRVNKHEPMNAPGNGLTCAIWWLTAAPVARESGLAATSARLVFMARIYAPDTQPQDDVDPAVLDATDALIRAYSAEFELGATVQGVDLLGRHGIPLTAQAGWLDFDDKKYRTADITIPLVVNDLWTQAP